MEILSGHYSEDTALMQEDYPYGFRLRCKRKVWLEYKTGKGTRFVSRTTDPRKSYEVWNKPKAETYMRFGQVLFLDEEGHVHSAGLTEYDELSRLQAFYADYGHTIPEEARRELACYIEAKTLYEAKTAEGMSHQLAAVHAAVKYEQGA